MACDMTPDRVMSEVDRIMSARWEWGTSDCTAAAADVFSSLWGVDPIAPIRLSYCDARGAQRIISQWGGMLAMGGALAAMAGLRKGIGASGEIGVSISGTGSGPDGRSALICIQPGIWAGKTLHGYAILPAAERCWRI